MLARTQDETEEDGALGGSTKLARAEDTEAIRSRQKAFDITFWLKFICLEVPARKVAYASYLLGEDKKLSLGTIGAVTLGIAMSPAFAMAWLLERVIYHASELFHLLRTHTFNKREALLLTFC